MRSDTEDGIGSDGTYNEEEHGRALRYSIGVEARGEEETRSTKNNMEENG